MRKIAFLAMLIALLLVSKKLLADATRYVDYGGKVPTKGNLDLRLDYTVTGSRTLEIRVFNSTTTFFSKNVTIAAYGDGNAGNQSYANWLTIAVTVSNVAAGGVAGVGAATLRIRTLNGSVVTSTTSIPVTITSGKQGFHIWSGKLYDAREVVFIPRGVNNPHIDADDGTGSAERYLAYHELDNIRKDAHANSVRIVWKTDNYFSKNWVSGATAPPGQRISGPPSASASNGENIYSPKTTNYPGILKLEKIIQKCIEQKMVPILELHDVTGNATAAGGDANYLKLMAQFWADNAWLLIKYRQYLIVNIANEWSTNSLLSADLHAGLQKWRNAYIESIRIIRNAGYSGTLIVDAPAYAQHVAALTYNDWVRSGDCSGCIITNTQSYAQNVLNNDPAGNVMFSLHMYAEWAKSVATSSCGQNIKFDIVSQLQNIKNINLPFMVGEFGHKHSGRDTDGVTRDLPIDYWSIMRECVKHGFGFMAWSWFGNGSGVNYLDLASGFSWNTLPNGSNFADGHSGNPYVQSETYYAATLSTNSNYITNGSCTQGGGQWGNNFVWYYDAAYNNTTYNNGNFGLGKPNVSRICSVFDASQPGAGGELVDDEEAVPDERLKGVFFPNPVHTSSTIHLRKSDHVPVRLTIVDQLGKIVFEKVFETKSVGENAFLFDVQECPACADGLYNYRILGGAQMYSGRILIQKR